MDVMILYQLNICLQPMALFVIVSLIIEPIQQKNAASFVNQHWTLRPTLKHWKHWIEFNVENLKNIDIALSFNVHFFDIKNIESKSMSMSVQTLNNETNFDFLYWPFVSFSYLCLYSLFWNKSEHSKYGTVRITLVLL